MIRHRHWLGAAAVIALAVGCAGGTASPPPLNTGRPAIGTVTEFKLPSGRTANSIVAGSDDAVWFTDGVGVGRVSAAGVITTLPFAVPAGTFTSSAVQGSDGSIWFYEYGSQSSGCLDHVTGGGVTRTCDPALALAGGMALGPDGNFWLVNLATGSVIRATPAGSVSRFPDGFPIDSIITSIAATPDGNLWYTGSPDARVGRISPSGTLLGSFVGFHSAPHALTTGADGNVWLAEDHAIARVAIASVAPAAPLTEFSSGLAADAYPASLTRGADGNVWFTDVAGRVGRITPAGAITEFATPGSHPGAITTGPDGNIWFTEDGAIARLIVK